MEICRVCLKSSDMLLNFTRNDCNRFFSVTGIEIKDPHEEFLCEECLDRLLKAFNFQEDALKADGKLLKRSLNQMETVEEDKEEEEDTTHVFDEAANDSSDDDCPSEKKCVTPTEPPLKSFKCIICDARFRSRALLKEHWEDHEPRKQTKFPCPFDGCDKIFQIKKSMKEHLRLRHLNPQNFICEYCAKSCTDRQKLKAHMNLHTGEKPYRCKHPDCSSSFRRSSDLYYHASSHSDKRPYACKDCDATYKFKSGLRSHRKIVHNDGNMLQCPECDKRFLANGYLQEHIAVAHRGERKFICRAQACSKTYTRPNHLKRHYHDSHPELYEEVVAKELHRSRNHTISTGKQVNTPDEAAPEHE